MEYRELGKTGLHVSEIGMGCEGMTEDNCAMAMRLLDRAQLSGINIFDLYSPDPALHRALGAALKGRRDKFIIQGHICSAWLDGQYKRTRKLDEVRAALDTQLANLGTDYLDIGMIHYVDSLRDLDEVMNGGVADYLRELRAQGRIRHTGMSSHNPEVALKAVESGLIEVLMFSVNPLYDLQPATEDVEELWAPRNYAHTLVNMDPARERLYETCQRLGVGITVMKAFGGGDLMSAELSPARAALTVNQLLSYALTRPAVASVMAGAHSVAQLETCLAYETATDTERDYAAALSSLKGASWQGHCMYCGHCAPCPQGIRVADVSKFLALGRAQGAVPETVREHYAALTHHAGECVECGACEKRCPFGVSVRENMRAAALLFGK